MQSLKSDLSCFPNVAIAEANRENIEKQYQKIKTEAEKESYLNRLNELVSHIKQAKHVSINMSTQSLLKFLRTGEYLNAHELIARGMRKPETIFYYQSRCSIEEALGYTEEIRKNIYYGTLNTGNLGAINFGLCCVVFKPESEIKLRVSFLKQNSLSYRKAEYPELKRDFAVWENVHQLAAIKHQDSIKERKLPFSFEGLTGLFVPLTSEG